jgi:hypothetical protein
MIARRWRTMIARRWRDGVAAVAADTQQCHNNAKTLDKLFRLAFISVHRGHVGRTALGADSS